MTMRKGALFQMQISKLVLWRRAFLEGQQISTCILKRVLYVSEKWLVFGQEILNFNGDILGDNEITSVLEGTQYLEQTN